MFIIVRLKHSQSDAAANHEAFDEQSLDIGKELVGYIGGNFEIRFQIFRIGSMELLDFVSIESHCRNKLGQYAFVCAHRQILKILPNRFSDYWDTV